MRKLTRLLIKNAGWVVGFSTLLTVVAGYFAVRLYLNLRPDIEELLPTTTRSVIDLDTVSRRIEAIDYLGVLVFTHDKLQGRRFSDALAGKLEQSPKTTVASVEYRVENEMHFFKGRQALYLELKDLELIRKYIRDTIRYEKEMYSPLNIFPVSDKVSKPKLDIQALEKKYQGKSMSFARFPGGYYATQDEGVHALLVYLPGKLAGVSKANEMRDTVDRAVFALNPKSFAPDLQVKYTGSVEDLLEEHDALVEDLEISSVIVLVLVAASLLLFYRSLYGTLALIVSLVMGTLWTFGISYFIVGYLNANSAFLGSIVLGNGINFGIIFLARYLEERRRRRGNIRALFLGVSATSKATLVAALAAGLSYGSLILTEFRGFRQFGIIGLIGMVVCWTSSYTVFPAFLTLLRNRFTFRSRFSEPKPFLTQFVSRLIAQRPQLIAIVTLVVTGASLAAIAINSRRDILELDLSKLGNVKSQREGSGFLSRYLDEIFQRNLSPIVILTDNRRDVAEIESRLLARRAEEGDGSLIADVYSFNDFVPKDQPQKIQILTDIAKELKPKIMDDIPQDKRHWMEVLRDPQARHEISEADLPELVRRKFREMNGAVGNFVLVEPPISHATWQGDRVNAFVAELRQIADSVKPGTPVVGTLPITSDMSSAIRRDGPRATAVALIVVCLLALVLFRNLRDTVQVLTALFLGVIWILGIVFGFQLKINFLNFIALPITFGIGVDYGVNIYQRYRLEGRRNIVKVILNTGGAVGLASLTTIIGYGSLLIASNQAFVSFGRLAILGEITCLSAAVISLPAYLYLSSQKESAGQTASEPVCAS